MLARVNANPRPPRSLGDGMLISGGVKMYMDGSGGARTAWMHDDWNKNLTEIDTGNAGYPATPPDAVPHRSSPTSTTPACTSARTPSATAPSTGWSTPTRRRWRPRRPRACATASSTPTRRPIAPSTTMARLQRDYDAAYPEASAAFMWWIGDNYAGNFGPQRNLRMKPFATCAEEGHPWGGGSDYPRDAVCRALRPVGLGGARDVERHVRQDAVRHGRSRRRAHRAQVVHDLGRAHDVPRRPHRLDRGGQGCRPRGVGSRPLHGADGGAQGHARPS